MRIRVVDLRSRIIVVVCAGIAACGGANNAGPGGKGGGGGGSGGSAGTAGASAGGAGGSSAGAGGSSAGAGGASAGAGGTIGGAGGAGGAGQGGSAGGGGAGGGGAGGGVGATGGSSGGAGGSSAGAGGSGGAGQAGTGGVAGVAGSGAGGIAEGTALLDITVTVGDKSTHITGCAPNDAHAASLEHYPNGNRVAQLHCAPTPNGTLEIYSFTIAPLATGIGQHDASELVFNCTLTTPIGCLGVADVAVTLSDGTMVEAYQTATKSGTFTLDQFTDDGRVSGSLDLSMSKSGGPTFMIKGNFAAHLHDCGQAPTGSGYDPCTGAPG